MYKRLKIVSACERVYVINAWHFEDHGGNQHQTRINCLPVVKYPGQPADAVELQARETVVYVGPSCFHVPAEART